MGSEGSFRAEGKRIPKSNSGGRRDGSRNHLEPGETGTKDAGL